MDWKNRHLRPTSITRHSILTIWIGQKNTVFLFNGLEKQASLIFYFSLFQFFSEPIADLLNPAHAPIKFQVWSEHQDHLWFQDQNLEKQCLINCTKYGYQIINYIIYCCQNIQYLGVTMKLENKSNMSTCHIFLFFFFFLLQFI